MTVVALTSPLLWYTARATGIAALLLLTAAIVWGEEGVLHVAQQGLAARFVRRGGAVLEVGGWPAPETPAPGPDVRGPSVTRIA